MIPRHRLRNRRESETIPLEFGGNRYKLTIGLYDDGRPGEAFIDDAKTGSHMAALLNDASILISLLLQHGVPASSFGNSLGKHHKDGEHCSVIGKCVGLLAMEERAVLPPVKELIVLLGMEDLKE